MSNLAPLNQHRTRAGSGKTGVVLLRIEPAPGYTFTGCAPSKPGEVYKVAIEDDQEVLDEVKACEIIRDAFKQGSKPGLLYVYTPLLPIKIMSLRWANRTRTGTIHYIPLKKFAMDGFKLLFTALDKKGISFPKTLHGLLSVFLRFLAVIHRRGVLHMDLGLQNSLFNSHATAHQGVVCDFQCATKKLGSLRGDRMYGDSWTTPLLAKCIPQTASEHKRQLWKQVGLGEMFNTWESYSTTNTKLVTVPKKYQPYIDFHTLAASLMYCYLYMTKKPRHHKHARAVTKVISCLVGDPREQRTPGTASSMLAALTRILSK